MVLSITLIIVVVTTLISLAAEANMQLKEKLVFHPVSVSRDRQWYRFFTCGFIHGGIMHLLFNMFSLYMFGHFVESSFNALFGTDGKWMYLLLYISALFISLLPTYSRHRDDVHYSSLGASGAVSAVIFAGLMLVPTVGVYLYFIPIPIPGFIFAPLYLVASAMLERRGGDNINHSAHIWGSLYGLAFMLIASRTVDYPILQNMIQEIQAYFKNL